MVAQNGDSVSQARGFGTLAVHAGAPHDPTTGAVIAPVSSPRQEFGYHATTNSKELDLSVYYIRTNQRWFPRRSLRVHSQFEPKPVSELGVPPKLTDTDY